MRGLWYPVQGLGYPVLRFGFRVRMTFKTTMLVNIKADIVGFWHVSGLALEFGSRSSHSQLDFSDVLSWTLNPLKVIQGIIQGSIAGVNTGDSRSSVYSSSRALRQLLWLASLLVTLCSCGQ